MGIFRRLQVEMPRVVLPKVELPTVEFPTLRMPRVDRLKIEIPEVTFPKLDADAIGQAIAKRLGRRRSSPVRLIFLVLVGGIALAWLAICPLGSPRPGRPHRPRTGDEDPIAGGRQRREALDRPGRLPRHHAG